MKAMGAKVWEAHQVELLYCKEYEKTVMAKDAELKAALAKVTDLEKALQDRDRAITKERYCTLLEAQHLDETFASKCFLLNLPG